MRLLDKVVALNVTSNSSIPLNPNYNETSLPSLSGNPNTITVSGFSAGSFMAMQLHVIFSEKIKGAGLVGGGPFGIPQKDYDKNNVTAALLAEKSESFAEKEAKEKKIDGLEHLKNAPVWHLKEAADKIIATNY